MLKDYFKDTFLGDLTCTNANKLMKMFSEHLLFKKIWSNISLLMQFYKQLLNLNLCSLKQKVQYSQKFIRVKIKLVS